MDFRKVLIKGLIVRMAKLNEISLAKTIGWIPPTEKLFGMHYN